MCDILLLVGRRLQGTSHFTRVIIRGETDPLLRNLVEAPQSERFHTC